MNNNTQIHDLVKNGILYSAKLPNDYSWLSIGEDDEAPVGSVAISEYGQLFLVGDVDVLGKKSDDYGECELLWYTLIDSVKGSIYLIFQCPQVALEKEKVVETKIISKGIEYRAVLPSEYSWTPITEKPQTYVNSKGVVCTYLVTYEVPIGSVAIDSIGNLVLIGDVNKMGCSGQGRPDDVEYILLWYTKIDSIAKIKQLCESHKIKIYSQP